MFVRAWCVVLFEETGGGGGLLTSKETEKGLFQSVFFHQGKQHDLLGEREREREREEVCVLHHHRDLFFFSLPLCRGTNNVVAFVRRRRNLERKKTKGARAREREERNNGADKALPSVWLRFDLRLW